MKNRDLLNLSFVLDSIDSSTCSAKFKYGISRNKKAIEDQVNILKDIAKPSEEYTSAENERLALCYKYCEYDTDGTPKMVNGFFVMKAETKDQSDKEINDIMEKYKSVFDEAIKKAKEFEAILDEDIDIKLHTIPIDSVPDAIKQSEMDIFTRLNIII